MKKILLTIALILLIPALSYGAAGSCVQTPLDYVGGHVKVSFVCTASSVDGSLPDTAIDTATMTLLIGKYHLYTVTAYPTSGGTAPDAADVFVLQNGEDLLGSVDGGTTANKGANLIHATLPKTAFPYVDGMGAFYTAPIKSALTVRVANQATHSANFTLEMVFEK
jgi:hypothetical protein